MGIVMYNRYYVFVNMIFVHSVNFSNIWLFNPELSYNILNIFIINSLWIFDEIGCRDFAAKR